MRRLALKYRPRKYEDVIGQSHVTLVLQKIHEKNEYPTGMLFKGSRGTGKTTTARVFGMAANCDGEDIPCGICDSCKTIIKDRSNSVIEIDAASHGLVDDIKTINERSQYGHGGKRRVWIIDEAANMSKAANNAFLKLLEEPPVDTIFILVTTEPEKILGTVRSRLIPFEFRRIDALDIVGRLEDICRTEDIDCDEYALEAIAKFVDGGMRDAINTLEYLYMYGDKVTIKNFAEIFGVTSRPAYDRLFNCILLGKHVEGEKFLEECLNRASEGSVFVRGLLKYLSNFLSYKYGVELDVDEDICKSLDKKVILDLIDSIWEILTKMKYSGDFLSFLPSVLYCKLAEHFGQVEELQVEDTDSILEEMRDTL